jgi:predicted amidohydrolase YtcJ
MLERNIFEIPPEEIGAVRVRMTVVGGKSVFDSTTTTHEIVK